MTPFEVVVVVSLLFMGVMSFAIRTVDRQTRIAARVNCLHERPGTARARAKTHSLLYIIRVLGDFVTNSKVMPTRAIAELEQSLAAAGFRGTSALSLFLGGKVLLLAFMPIVAIVALRGHGLSPLVRYGTIAGAAIIGLLLPDMIMSRLRTRYLQAVEAGLADALDMMVICAEAGLALEASIDRVATEVDSAHAAVASELRLTANEMRISSDRRVALVNMGLRTGLPSLKRLGGTLIQTMQYGTPLGHALRTLSVELRQETLTRFEERAARLPVLLTLPMILFILPCVFIVVGGPAGIQISRQLLH